MEIGIVEYNVKNILTCGNNDQVRRCLFSFLTEDWTGRMNLIHLVKIY